MCLTIPDLEFNHAVLYVEGPIAVLAEAMIEGTRSGAQIKLTKHLEDIRLAEQSAEGAAMSMAEARAGIWEVGN